MDEQLQACWQENLTDLTNFFNSERFFGKKRHYTPADIAPLRNSFKVNYPSTVMSDKLNNMLRTCFNNNSFELTYGALDPVQVINLSKYLKCVYVSGWQCSSTASVTNEPGPDFADYPVNTVPSKVDQLFKAQLFHDRKQNEMLSRLSPKQLQETKIFDYMAPMLADADTGFGGTTAIMKLTKLFIESGAAGIHIED
jgi:isocitrate lyase